MRNGILGTFLLFASAVLTGGEGRGDEPPKKLSDAEISKLLVGKWAGEESGKGFKINATTNYKKDGTFEGEATLELDGKSTKLTVSGTWKVSDGTITEKVTKSSDKELIPEDLVTKDQVISVDDKLLKLKNEKGKEKIRKRVGK